MGQRLLSLDFIKLFAMFGVICLHTEMNFYENPLAQFLYMTAVVSIPLFFMTSGYLLYGKQSVDYHYSAHKIVGILRFVAIMTITFWLLTGMRHGESFWWFTAGSLIQKGNLGIYWYFGAMMILYALLPMQHKLYVKYPKAFLLGTIVLGIVSNCIFLSNFYGYEIEENTIQTFRLWNWIFYFNLGGILRRYTVKSSLALVIVLFIFNYLFQYELIPLMPTVYCEYFYCSLPVMLLSFFFFVYAVKIDDSKLQFVCGGGKLFLPCYTFHIFIIGKTMGKFEQYIYSISDYTAPFFWIIVAILTVIISWLIMKFPYMDRIFRI